MEKICKQCGNRFEVTEADTEFYQRMRVPVPELCPRCGVERLMALRNERNLYTRTCDKCGRTTLSIYHPKATYTVYCHDCWWKDDWDAVTFGIDFNPNRPLPKSI